MRNLLTYCTILFLTANSLFAYNFSPSLARHARQAVLDSLGIDENPTEDKIMFVKTSNRLKTSLKLTHPLLNDDVLFSNEVISVMKVHPNPATIVAYLDYNMSAKVQAKITISNLLGKVIDEFPLQEGEHKLKIPASNYSSGIYLYTLSINGKAMKTKKLVIDGR